MDNICPLTIPTALRRVIDSHLSLIQVSKVTLLATILPYSSARVILMATLVTSIPPALCSDRALAALMTRILPTPMTTDRTTTAQEIS